MGIRRERSRLEPSQSLNVIVIDDAKVVAQTMSTVIYCDTISQLHIEMNRYSGTTTPHILVLPEFVPPITARLVQSAFASAAINGGSSIYHSSAVPLYEHREESDSCLDDYLKEASRLWLEHRRLLESCDDPIVRFMTEWTAAAGVEVQRLELAGQPCFFGQYRCFGGEDIKPHVDAIEREFPTVITRPTQQWALNISVRAPRDGGELDIWGDVPSYGEYRGYGLTRPVAEPALRYRPSVGDLYVFEPRFVHAINASSSPRCALAGFVGVWKDQSIRVWS